MILRQAILWQAILRLVLCLFGCSFAASLGAQQLDARFSCSETRDEDGERVIYADSGEFRLDGSRVDAFRWESSQFRPTHGFDCSIDDSDGVQAEVRDGAWRIGLTDGAAARKRRGYDFFQRGLNCSIRLERNGDALHVKPSCPALCGSRLNFSELTVDLKTGGCRYVQER